MVSRRNTDSRRSRQEQTTQAINDWKSGKITQKEAAERAANIRRGGGSGAGADPELLARALETERRQAAAQEATRQQAAAKAERGRIAGIEFQKAEQVGRDRAAVARRNVAARDAERAARVSEGPTGEVHIDTEIINRSKRIKTGRRNAPVVTERQGVEGGTIESRVVDNRGGIPSTKLTFVPDFGSELPVTPEQRISFRDKQNRVDAVPQSVGIPGAQQDIMRMEGEISTRALRGQTPEGFAGIKEGLLSVGGGVALSAVGTAGFVGGAFKDPLGTLKNTEQGLLQLDKDITSGKTFRDVGNIVSTNPGFALGFAGTEIATDLLIGKGFDTGLKLTKRGATRLSPDFVGVSVDDISSVQRLKNVPDIGDIELIPKQDLTPALTLPKETITGLPKDITGTPAFKGPFGNPASSIESLTGKKGPVLTSAQDLFGSGAKGSVDGSATLTKLTPSGDFGDISLFATPFRIADDVPIAQTRISRLGSDPGTASFADLLSGNFELGGGTKSQVIAFPDETIGKNFKAVQFTPGELEVTLTGERFIKKTGTTGRTLIDKKPVTILTAQFDDIPAGLLDDVKLSRAGKLDVGDTAKLNKELTKASGFTSSELNPSSLPIVGASTFSGGGVILRSLNRGSSSSSSSSSVSSIISPKLSPGNSSGGSIPIVTSPGKSTKRKEESIISPISSPPGGSSLLRSLSSPISPISPPPYSGGGGFGGFGSVIRPPKIKQPYFKKQFGSFGVQIRRQGKFFNVGNFKTQSLAFQRGQKLTSSTLAATFKLTGLTKAPKAPKGFYTKRTGNSILFIEKRGKRLSKKTETKEITAAKKKKAKPRKKKK